jgi:4-amino-4-deoxy-L-arabinose transferase-like glycosyltransferase
VRSRYIYLVLFIGVLATRLCHTGIVWVEEAYPLAAAREMMRGEWLYRDIWFDKPPLFPMIYLLWGALDGWPMRVTGALYILISMLAIGRFARARWGEPEEGIAALLTAFALTFWIPSAVMVLGPDLLLIPIQTMAVWAAWRGKGAAAGLWAGAGMFVNGKTLFLLPAMFVPSWSFAAALIVPHLLVLPVAQEYWKQVWAWGAAYSKDTFVVNPLLEGLKRSLNWAGFHCAAIIGTIAALAREPGKRFWFVWLLCAGLAVVAGFRFAPRYYFLLLPPVALLGAHGIVRNRRWLLILLLIPLIRFGPRYLELGAELLRGQTHVWTDLALEQDSRAAASYLRTQSGDLLVWGYRPELYVLSGMPAGTRFLDSQPLTGVLADRHLTYSTISVPGVAAMNRRELIRTRPAWIADGLGPYNPNLAITAFPDLAEWLRDYEQVHRTAGTVIYRRR